MQPSLPMVVVKQLIEDGGEDFIRKVGKRWTTCNDLGGHAVVLLAVVEQAQSFAMRGCESW